MQFDRYLQVIHFFSFRITVYNTPGIDTGQTGPERKTGSGILDLKGQNKERIMIITTIRMTVPHEKRQELLQTVGMLAGTVRKESGCRACDFYIDTENADAFLLMEEWDTQEDFERHVRAAAFSALLGAMTLLYERPDVRINFVADRAGMEKIKAARAA
jgi:quinol monooxygenase YgiN